MRPNTIGSVATRYLLLFFTLAAIMPARVHASPEALPNFHTVGPGIYRGGAPTDEGLRELKAKGVKTIVDLRIAPKTVHKEKLAVLALGFQWINLPMGSEPPTKKQVDTLLATLRAASPSNPVYVHCQHGADRTGCMIGIYRVHEQGWKYQAAYTEMRKYGFKPYYTKLSNSVRKYAKN